MPDLHESVDADEVRILRAQPGDIVILRFKESVSHSAARHIIDQMRGRLPEGVTCAILDRDTSIEVVRTMADVEEATSSPVSPTSPFGI